jgi:release factor glutamine methyltransferase
MGANVLEHEPEMALFVSNENPLLFYKSIAEIAKVYLKLSGNIFFEIHEDFASEVMAILKSLKFVNIELRKDLQGKDRMVRAQKLSSQL